MKLDAVACAAAIQGCTSPKIRPWLQLLQQLGLWQLESLAGHSKDDACQMRWEDEVEKWWVEILCEIYLKMVECLFKYQCFLFVLVILSFNVILFEPVINMCSLSFVGLCCFCSCCCCCCWVVLLLVLVVVVATVVEKITLSSCTISTLLVLGCCCSLCSGGRKWCDWLPAIVHPLWAWGLGQL